MVVVMDYGDDGENGMLKSEGVEGRWRQCNGVVVRMIVVTGTKGEVVKTD